ncbi:MAG: hypothetical protein LC122_09445 [Chitinophagales bacterium]|nr:hypothetical protein [Chitinophagales bacterium]
MKRLLFFALIATISFTACKKSGDSNSVNITNGWRVNSTVYTSFISDRDTATNTTDDNYLGFASDTTSNNITVLLIGFQNSNKFQPGTYTIYNSSGSASMTANEVNIVAMVGTNDNNDIGKGYVPKYTAFGIGTAPTVTVTNIGGKLKVTMSPTEFIEVDMATGNPDLANSHTVEINVSE